jgi:hypothetical protein
MFDGSLNISFYDREWASEARGLAPVGAFESGVPFPCELGWTCRGTSVSGDSPLGGRRISRAGSPYPSSPPSNAIQPLLAAQKARANGPCELVPTKPRGGWVTELAALVQPPLRKRRRTGHSAMSGTSSFGANATCPLSFAARAGLRRCAGGIVIEQFRFRRGSPRAMVSAPWRSG